MKRETHSQIELPIQPLIDNDLPPLYLLTEPQYQFIINRMTNLLGEVAQRLAQTGNAEIARIATEQGYEILRDYDDDAAEALRSVTQTHKTEQSRFGNTRDIGPFLS